MAVHHANPRPIGSVEPRSFPGRPEDWSSTEAPPVMARAIEAAPETRRLGRNSSVSDDFASRPWRNFLQTNIEVPCVAVLLRPPAGGGLLELGCGRGIAFEALARTCAPSWILGVDHDPHAVNDARRALKLAAVPGEVMCADVAELPLADDSVRIVIDFGTSYRVPDPSAVLVEVERVLEPGGVFIHESALAQRLAHPRRATGRRLPWSAAPSLIPRANAVLWCSRYKVGVPHEHLRRPT